MNKCGNCRLCCKLFSIDDGEVQKQCNEWCKHSCDKGCAIYDERPETCRKFSCWWLDGGYSEEWRPDKVGITIVPQNVTNNSTGETVEVAMAFQRYPGAAMGKKAQLLLPVIRNAAEKVGMGFGVATPNGKAWNTVTEYRVTDSA